MHRAAFALAAALAAVAASPALADNAYTTRIEPRPFYGATISIEEGVRVFRALPPTRHVIVNPGNAPLNLSFTDVTERRTNHTYNYNNGSDGAAGPSYGGGYGLGGIYGGFGKHGSDKGRNGSDKVRFGAPVRIGPRGQSGGQ